MIEHAILNPWSTAGWFLVVLWIGAIFGMFITSLYSINNCEKCPQRPLDLDMDELMRSLRK